MTKHSDDATAQSDRPALETEANTTGNPRRMEAGLIEAVQLIRAWEDTDELAITLARRLFVLYEGLSREHG